MAVLCIPYILVTGHVQFHYQLSAGLYKTVLPGISSTSGLSWTFFRPHFRTRLALEYVTTCAIKIRMRCNSGRIII